MHTIGHRGAAGYEIENTAKAIQKALDLQIGMVELDVRACASGELVVFHDATVNRITNGRGAVKNLTLAELKVFRTTDGQNILTLFEALDLIGGRCWVNLDIKSRGVAKKLLPVLHAATASKKWKLRQFLISSFNHRELQRIKKADSHVRIGLLYFRRIGNALKKAKKMSAYSIHFNVRHLRKSIIDALHRDGVKSFVWTVNTPTDMKRMYKLGVDGIISDFPDRI